MQLIIPAYNEEHRLPSTLDTLRSHVLAANETPGPVEVIVVDNASTDRTAEVARAADTAVMPVRVVTCAVRGKGAAVRAGALVSTADVVGFLDADGATDLAALQAADRLLRTGADMAIGSRALPGSVTMERHSALRALGARVYRRLAAGIVPDVADTQCGFKVMYGDLARSVFADLRTSGFSFDVELLARARAQGAEIVEFPVVWKDVPGSTFVPALHGLASFGQLARISWQLQTERRAAVRAQVVPVSLTVGRPAGSATGPGTTFPSRRPVVGELLPAVEA